MSFFGFGQTADIEIVFDDADKRKVADVKTDDGKKEKLLLYYDGEAVSGKVNVTLRKPGSKLEHQGIKVELIGQIELFYDRGNHHEFISLVKELARPGDLLQHTSYPFEFANVDKPYEVYTGSNVRLRYFLRATIVRRLTDVVKEVDVAVHTLCSYPDMLNSIKMEVGIEDCLHIEFEYNKSKYHLKDVIVGKIYFLLVRIKIKHMEISIIKRETTGTGPNTFTENETVAKYEIMDGAPVKGESIPIRVFLAGYDLTPTMRDINNKFSVRYYLNLVLMDTEDRRYFKQQEVTLWRKSDKSRLPLHNQHETVITTRGQISHDDSLQTTSPLNIENTFVKTMPSNMPLEHPEIRNGPSPMEEDIVCSREIEKKLTDTHINEEKLPEIIGEKKDLVQTVEKSKKVERQLEPPLLADKPLNDSPAVEIQEPKLSGESKIEKIKTETSSIVKQEIIEEPPLGEKPSVAEKPLISVKPNTPDKPLVKEKPVIPAIAIKEEILEKPQVSEKPISVKIEKSDNITSEKPLSPDKSESKQIPISEKSQKHAKPPSPEKPQILEKPQLAE